MELEQTERLDAQFVEYLRCRGMNPTVNTDSAAGSMSYSDDLLSPELQVCSHILISLSPGFTLFYFLNRFHFCSFFSGIFFPFRAY